MTVKARRSESKKPQGLTIALSKGKLLGPVLHSSEAGRVLHVQDCLLKVAS